MRVLVTGGAGFVGSHLALRLKSAKPDFDVCAFDNLRRRGSELALQRLQSHHVEFVHGDVRLADDLSDAGPFDLLLECSAEPSVQAGYDGSPAFVLQTNLNGTINCLEAARRCRASVIFLSTSRVYPIEGLRAIRLIDQELRFDVAAGASGTGWSASGITTDFPLSGARSLYGATKLASELLIEEYRAMYGLRTIVNRCGVIAGPWQMGKVDQGFVVLWAGRHLFNGRLTYNGWGGTGRQVRDVLHIEDLCDLIEIEIEQMDRLSGCVVNVGGGRSCSVSLAELTRYCQIRTGKEIAIGSRSETNDADVPYYITDNSQITDLVGWAPRRSIHNVVDDVVEWLAAHRTILQPVLAGPEREPRHTAVGGWS
jgi:CDP-paratose 2-epimerase